MTTPKEWRGIECKLIRLNEIAKDQKTVAKRQWQKPTPAPAPQKPCDIGLFSDDHLQLDLVEMLMEPDYDAV